MLEELLCCRTPYPGGAPANVATALAKLDCKSAFISALGQDDLAKQMIELLEGKASTVPCHCATVCWRAASARS